jgi:GntR family transcriptional regulator / MocR family aminotransferase
LPDQAIASGTPFAKISSDWRCPDCGTEKTTFRPYVESDHHHSIGKRQII